MQPKLPYMPWALRLFSLGQTSYAKTIVYLKSLLAYIPKFSVPPHTQLLFEVTNVREQFRASHTFKRRANYSLSIAIDE